MHRAPQPERILPAGRALAIMVCAALSLTGSRATGAAPPAPGRAGVVRCAGGSTMLPLVEAGDSSFRAQPPGRGRNRPARNLAADGFRELLAGRVDLVDFVREPFPAEIAAFRRKFGYPPLSSPSRTGVSIRRRHACHCNLRQLLEPAAAAHPRAARRDLLGGDRRAPQRPSPPGAAWG